MSAIAPRKIDGVELLPVDKPNASREARIGVEIRNALAFKFYGNATGMPPTHRLVLRFNTTRSSLMTDPLTAVANPMPLLLPVTNATAILASPGFCLIVLLSNHS